jgi:hypothetical protein
LALKGKNQDAWTWNLGLRILSKRHDAQLTLAGQIPPAVNSPFNFYAHVPASIDRYDGSDSILDDCLHLLTTTGIKDILKMGLMDVLQLDPYVFRKVKLFVEQVEKTAMAEADKKKREDEARDAKRRHQNRRKRK